MHLFKRFTLSLSLAIFFSIFLFNSSFAQESENTSSSRLDIEEIVVTGTKREIGQQDAPIAISTLTEQRSKVLDKISAHNAAIVIGLPRIEPELSINKVTIVSLKSSSFSFLKDKEL